MSNLKENIISLAKIQNKNNQSQSKYYNQITEFFGVWFVSHKLCNHVIAMENSPQSVILSPHTANKKSCDIRAKNGSADLYFEVKDLSKEVLTRQKKKECPDLTFFSPPTPTQKEKWIKNKIRESALKGANYLICRIPIWQSPGVPGFGTRWVRKIFRDSKKIANKKYLVPVNFQIPPFFKGVYIIKNMKSIFIQPKYII